MDLLVALAVFCVVTLFTPGPNNLMLMTSGLNYGFRRGLPHLLGVVLGFTLMVLIVGLGLGAIFQAWPMLYVVLKYAGAAYLLYLAWEIAVSLPPGPSGVIRGQADRLFPGGRLSMGQSQGLGDGRGRRFQLCGGGAVSVQRSRHRRVVWRAGCRLQRHLARFRCGLQRVLKNRRAVRAFNIVMALLLVASLYPIIADGLPGTTP